MVKNKIELADELRGIVKVNVKDVMQKTNLSPTFCEDRIFLQTQDGNEGCELEYHYDSKYDGNDPREAIIDALYVGSKVPVNLITELENKLYLKFIIDW